MCHRCDSEAESGFERVNRLEIVKDEKIVSGEKKSPEKITRFEDIKKNASKESPLE